LCSHEWPFSKLRYVGLGRWYCPDDAPGLTAEQLARHQAQLKPLRVRPRRHAKESGSIPEYRGAEALTFRLVLDHGLTRQNVTPTGAGASSPSQADRMGACGMYLAEIIDENERPVQWISQARTGLRTFADGVLGLQYGSPTGLSPSEATDSVLYGGATGVTGSTVQSSLSAIFGGLCLIRAYRILGDQKYLDGASRFATWLRHVQRRDVWVTSPTTNPYLGAFMDQITIAGKSPSTNYTTYGAGALWFLAELKAIVGGSASYGIAAASGDFSAATVGTIDQMAEDALAFYVGNKISGWSVYGGNSATGTFAPMSPLSAETPRHQYAYGLSPNPFNLLSLGGKWTIQMGTNFPFSLGLRGVYEWEGYTARVASVYNWLVSLGVDPASAEPEGTVISQLSTDLRGPFDPQLCPPAFVEVEDPVTFARVDRNWFAAGTANSDYSVTALALLAPIRAAAGSDLRVAKEDFTAPVRATTVTLPGDPALIVYPHLKGLAGLSGQGAGMVQAAETTWAVIANAALCGSLFRYAPKGYPSNKAG